MEPRGRLPGAIVPTSSRLTWQNRWDHWLARWSVNRGAHRVTPGLYALGQPNPESPVFVTANYTLSFDALRSALPGMDGYILVLDTKGINVWCAAGKGTFGTDELVRRIELTRLADVVARRVVILPQLGATGVAAHDVKRRSGFRVEYGPVRARDLPEYLRAGQATRDMRRVRFDWADRLVLVPVEIVHTFVGMIVGAVILFVIGGFVPALAALAAVLGGCVLFPLLLPWLPTREFSSKGFILGTLVALPFASAVGFPTWFHVVAAAHLAGDQPARHAGGHRIPGLEFHWLDRPSRRGRGSGLR